MDPFSVVGDVLEIIFLGILAFLAWKNRANKLVFWGWIAVVAMLAVAYFYFQRFPRHP